MKLDEYENLRILTPERGYKLYSVSSNSYSYKVCLGVNDSIDNYREVIDEEYVDIDVVTALKESQVVNDEQDSMIIDMATEIAVLQLSM